MAKTQKHHDYHEQNDINNMLKLREISTTLPLFCREFFLGIKDTTTTRTRLAYAYDLQLFFEYLHKYNPICRKIPITELNIKILDMIEAIDITGFMDYLTFYVKNGKEYTNDARGKQRKLSALRSMYNYFYRAEKIEKNPASRVPTPKIHEKEIIRLDIDEVVQLLDNVESGEKLTPKQMSYHEKTKVRDLAIMTLLLGTGIRVSECVGLNIQDVDFNNNGLFIKRKGGYEQIVYFGDEVEKELREYCKERSHLIAVSGSEKALFLSLQGKRMSVRTVEKLVKKYANTVTTIKRITPHKLRSTFGTSLYNETGDIYLVADVLGHKDVNTTKKHYAAQNQIRLRRAANAVKLREY